MADGNIAAMREALDDIIDKIDTWRSDGTIEHWQYSQLFDIADAALAAPVRNCDRFATAEEAYAAWHEWLDDFDDVEAANAFDWLFSTEGGAE